MKLTAARQRGAFTALTLLVGRQKHITPPVKSPASTNQKVCFYRAMHYSAKRGIAIVCSLSVCLSVTLVDQEHIGWRSWELIAWTISLLITSPTL